MPTFLVLVTVLFSVFLSSGQKPLSLVTSSHPFVIIPLTFSLSTAELNPLSRRRIGRSLEIITVV